MGPHGGRCRPVSARPIRSASAAGAARRLGVWKGLFEAVQEPDLDWVMPRLNGRAGPRPSGGQPKKSRVGDEALGRSRGGLTTKVPALVDALGNPLRLVLGPGQQADCRRAAELLAGASGAGNVLPDKAYDTNDIVALVEELGAAVVIPSKKNRFVQRAIDRNLYRDRNKVERFFSRLKQFRRLATRYDKTACSFLGMLHFVSALLWLR